MKKGIEHDLALEEREGEFDLTPVVYEHHGIWIPGGLIPACMVPGEQVGEHLKPLFAAIGFAMIAAGFIVAAIPHLF